MAIDNSKITSCDEMDVEEPESETPLLTSLTQPGKYGGELKVGNPGNRGGTGRPKNSVRQLARDKGPRVIKRLARIVEGESFLDADGVKQPVTYTHVIQAGKVLIETGFGPDAIPEALIAATARVLSQLTTLLDRPGLMFTPEEMDTIGKALDGELGNARVV